MTSHDDEVVPADERVDAPPAAGNKPTRLFTRVREALFESTQRSEPAPLPTASTASPQQPELVSGMMATLRELATREAGAALCEFNLQLDAVRELVPDSGTRLRIALSVLAKKGISRQALEQDLDRASTLFSQQLNSFLEKVAARQREHELELEAVQSAYDLAGTKHEVAIAAHEAALIAEREALTKAGVERQRQLAELESSRDGLAQKERAFRAAHARVQAEHQELSRELRGLFGEKP